MKTEEQILNEYARLVPVSCFVGHQDEWDGFVRCCKAFKDTTLNLWSLREIILKHILGEHRGHLLSIINPVTRGLGSRLIDEADKLFYSLDTKIFDPKYLIRFENSEEVLEACFPPGIIPDVSKKDISFVRQLDENNQRKSFLEIYRETPTEATLNQYIRNLTGIETAALDYCNVANGIVFARSPTRTTTLRFRNAYQYDVIPERKDV